MYNEIDEFFLLDANLLIEADNDYYPFEAIPHYWNELRNWAIQGRVKMPSQVFREVRADRNRQQTFGKWLKSKDILRHLVLHHKIRSGTLHRVYREGYLQKESGASALDATEIRKVQADAYLVAAAIELASPSRQVTVVTREVPAPSKKRANRRIPDICESLQVRWIDDPTFRFEKMAFSIKGSIEYGADWTGQMNLNLGDPS